MLLLPLLYECSVTTVLLSGANERRHYQRIGLSLTPLPENKMDQIVNLAMFTMDRTVTRSVILPVVRVRGMHVCRLLISQHTCLPCVCRRAIDAAALMSICRRHHRHD